MNNTAKNLRIASVIQLVLGIFTLLLTQVLMKNGTVTNMSAGDAMMNLMAVYAGAGLQIVAGLVGLLRAGKKSLFAFILGILLYLPQLWGLFSAKGELKTIIWHIIMLAIAYFYMHNAYQNYKRA